MDAITQIGEFLSSGVGKGVLTAGAAGTGLIQNILANREAQKKQKFVENLISNPAAFSKYVSQFEKPLTAGLTADVSRATDAYGAERGLGSSSTVMRDLFAQALAPYIQQQKAQASNDALSALGIYGNTPTTRPVDISSVLKAILQGTGGANPNVSAGINPASVTNVGLTPADLSLPGSVDNPAPLPSPIVGSSGFDPSTMEGG